jgi:hypothetical protein
MGIEGESQGGLHDSWTDLSGSDSSVSQGPPPDTGSGSGGLTSPESSGAPPSPSKGTGINPTLIIAGLMLIMLAGLGALAIRGRQESSPEGEEMVLEPEVVSLDEGSATLNISYSTEDADFFTANGADDVQLKIVPKESSSDLYEVNGTLKTVQDVVLNAMDQGDLCAIDIMHDVTYTVKGMFNSSECIFGIEVSLARGDSQLLAQDCSVNINLDPSGYYVAPQPGSLVFTKAMEQVSSLGFKFYLHNMNLPKGANCPAFSG